MDFGLDCMVLARKGGEKENERNMGPWQCLFRAGLTS